MEVWMGYLHDLTTRLRQFRAAHEVRRHMERAHRPSHVHEANTSYATHRDTTHRGARTQ